MLCTSSITHWLMSRREVESFEKEQEKPAVDVNSI
jgi:hypothetical protein